MAVAKQDRVALEATADEIADLLEVSPEKVNINFSDNEIVLSHALARRLVALARKNVEA